MGLQQAGTADQALRGLAQLAQHEVALFLRWHAGPDREIESFCDHIHPSVQGPEVDLDSRMIDHETRDELAEMVAEQARRAAHPDHALRLGADGIDHRLRRLGLDQHGKALLVVFLADLGHREAAT